MHLLFFSKSFREMAYKSKLSFKILSMIAVNKVEMSPSLASLLFWGVSYVTCSFMYLRNFILISRMLIFMCKKGLLGLKEARDEAPVRLWEEDRRI
jgi:hypothetical protein